MSLSSPLFILSDDCGFLDSQLPGHSPENGCSGCSQPCQVSLCGVQSYRATARMVSSDLAGERTIRRCQAKREWHSPKHLLFELAELGGFKET